MGDGWLGAIRYDNAAEKQAGIAAMARDYGQELQFLDVADVRRLLDTARLLPGPTSTLPPSTCIPSAMP